jgi:hypothetical protein
MSNGGAIELAAFVDEATVITQDVFRHILVNDIGGGVMAVLFPKPPALASSVNHTTNHQALPHSVRWVLHIWLRQEGSAKAEGQQLRRRWTTPTVEEG